MSEVVVLGSGFAGLWAALGAARRLDELGVADGDVNVTVLSSQPYHDIRVRNYESDLTRCRLALRDVLDPVGVAHIAADVTAIDPTAHTVTTSAGAHRYDRLVIALGSQVVKPDVDGLSQYGFDVDTYNGAVSLQQHLADLAGGAHTPAAATAVVVGAGLTGVETACELPARLNALFPDVGARVILVDHNPHVGSDMGASARPVIEAGLTANGVESRLGTRFTIDTVTSLQRRFPQVDFVWLMGSDNLEQFSRWRRWRDIAACIPIAVLRRPGSVLATLRAALARRLEPSRRLGPAPSMVVLDGSRSDESSTRLRAGGVAQEAMLNLAT